MFSAINLVEVSSTIFRFKHRRRSPVRATFRRSRTLDGKWRIIGKLGSILVWALTGTIMRFPSARRPAHLLGRLLDIAAVALGSYLASKSHGFGSTYAALIEFIPSIALVPAFVV
jgi:hypothetical protein